MKKKKLSTLDDEPDWFADDEVVEYGGELIWAVDFTSGGAPIGTPLRELIKIREHDMRTSGWVRAKRAFERAFSDDGSVEIGRVRKIGEGLSRYAYSAWIDFYNDRERCGKYVALLCRDGLKGEELEQFRRETQILAKLTEYDLPFAIPRVYEKFEDDLGPVVIQSMCEGLELDLRAGRQHRVRPWETVGQVAASIHTLPAKHFSNVLEGHETRLEFARAELERSFSRESEEPLIRDAYQWTQENLPAEEPTVVLHGDLLGQNILLSLEGKITVLDWQLSRIGDPAYDFAIVTRGVRKPFQLADGLKRLLSVYHEAGGKIVKRHEVHLYEICLILGWYFHAKNEGLSGSGRAGAELGKLKGVLERAVKSV